MAKILFCNTYFYRLDRKQWKMKQPYPPLGTLLAAAVARESGHSVSFFDTNLQFSPENIGPKLEKESPDYVVIYDDGFNYLTKMCLTVMRDAATTMAAIAKSHDAKVIICSSDSTDHIKHYLNNQVDFVVLGEGEETTKCLLEALEREAVDLTAISGLAFRDAEGKLINTGNRPVLRELDNLSRPAWDLVDIEPYRQIWQQHHGYFSLNLATTRGCPYKCNWCAKPIYGNRYNIRSPKNVVDEIEYLMAAFDVDYFWVCDDIFGLKPGWVQEFRDIVKERDLHFKYKIQSRVDLMLKDDTIAALVQSGLDTVWVGAESGSQKILDAMDKGTRVDQIYEATAHLKNSGVKVAYFLQFGYLGETKDDIDKTISMVLDCMPDEIGISVSYPLPGTKFYEKVKEDLEYKANWTDSDDLDMMFVSTFRPAYYKRLHRYVHKVYRRKQGWLQLQKFLRNPIDSQSRQWKKIAKGIYYALGASIDWLQLRRLQMQR